MSTRRRGSSGTGRFVWGGLVLVLLAGLGATFFLSGGAVASAEDEAQARAANWAGAVLFDALTPAQLQDPIPEAEYRQLLLAVQAGILSDERAVRVRVWNTDHTLALSTDQLDAVGEVVALDDPQISAALGGQTVSTVTPARVAPSGGLSGTDEKLFQTSVPLQLQGALGISGVAQIEQRYSSIESAAAGPWRTVRIGLVLALTAAAIMLVLSLRRRPASTEVPDDATDEAPAPRRQDRKAVQRAARAEQDVRAAEGRAAHAESAAAEARSTSDEALERVRELEERAARAEERAASAEERLREAAELATGGEPVRRGVPGIGAVATGGAVATLEADTRVASELRQAVAELDDMRLKLSFAEASLQEKEQRLAERESTAVQIEQAWRAAGRELEETRAALAEKEAELRSAQDAAEALRSHGTGAGSEGQDVATVERLHAAEQRAEAEAIRAEHLEVKVGQVEAELAQILAAAEAMATELEVSRRSAGETAGTVSTSERPPEVSGDEVGELMARVAELESQRRTDISELQRAQEALANTQLEATKARKRAKEMEERLHELESGGEEAGVAEADASDDLARYLEEPVEATRYLEAPVEPTRSIEAPPVPAGSIAARLASLTRDREAGRSTEAPPDEEARVGEPEPEPVPEPVAPVEEEGLSLRERLARAAAARHRAPGAPGSGTD